MINTILFDLDGTLVDTELAAAKAIHACFKKWGLPVSEEDAGYITGRTWASAADYLFKKYPLPTGLKNAEEACHSMIEAYRECLKTDLTLVPGGAAAVRALALHGHDLALVSGSNRTEIFWALDKLGVREHFKVVLGAEDYPNSKPAPDGYIKALQMLGRDAKRTLVFEDSHAGISSAIAAGTWVVAISGTNHYQQDTSRAHHHIPDLSEVNATWVTNLSKKLGVTSK